MRTLKHLTKPLGIAMLAGTMISATPGLNSGSFNLSSTDDITVVGAPAQQAPKTGVSGTSQVRMNRDGQIVDINYQAKVEQVMETVVVNNEIIQRPSDKNQIQVTFSSDKVCGDCISPLVIGVEQVSDIKNQVTNHLRNNGTQISDLYAQELENKKKREEFEKDLAKEKKREAKCEVKVEVDRANLKVNPITLDREERLDCKQDLIAEGDYDSPEEELQAFNDLFGDELEDIVKRGDASSYKELREIYARMKKSTNNPAILQQVQKARTYHQQSAQVNQLGETLVNPNAQSYQKEFAQQQLNHMSQSLSLQGSTDNSWQALAAAREGLLANIQSKLNSALEVPEFDYTPDGRYSRSVNAGAPRPTSNTQSVFTNGAANNRFGSTQQIGNVPTVNSPYGQQFNGMTTQAQTGNRGY